MSLNKVAKRPRHFTQHACQALYSEQSRAFGQGLRLGKTRQHCRATSKNKPCIPAAHVLPDVVTLVDFVVQ